MYDKGILMKKTIIILFLLIPLYVWGQHGEATTVKTLQQILPDSVSLPNIIYQTTESGKIPIRLFYAFSQWITHNEYGDSVRLGIIPSNSSIIQSMLYVEEKFNSITYDSVKVGYSPNPDAYLIETDVSAKGVKNLDGLQNGNKIGKTEDLPRTVWIYHTHAGSNPTTGKALATIIWMVTEPIPD